MIDYKLVPVELLKDWHERINTIADEMAFNVADEIEAILAAAPAVQGRPMIWVYSYIDGTEVQTSEERWTGRAWKPYWKETPLYTHPQPEVSVSEIIEAVANFVGSQKGGPFTPAVIKAAIIAQLKYGNAFTKLLTSPATCTPKQQPEPDELSDYDRGFRDGILDRLIDEVVAESKLAEVLEICLEMEERPKIIKLAREALATYRKQ